jgi:hypothetical protein
MDLEGVYIGLALTIVANVAIISYGYGRIHNTVDRLCKGFDKHLEDCKADMGEVHHKCNLTSEKVAHLEGKIGEAGKS